MESNRSARRLAQGILGAAAGIAIITVVARLTGFGRWLVYSGTVGATCVGDAYSAANQIPNVLFELAAGGALAVIVIPLIAEALATGATAETDRVGEAVEPSTVVSVLVTWTVLILTPIAVLIFLTADPLGAWLVHTSNARGSSDLACAVLKEQIAADMLQIFAPQVVLYGVGAVLVGSLHAARKFMWPAVAPLWSSLVVIISYVMYRKVGGGVDPSALAWLAWGTTAGVAALSLPLLIPVRAAGIRVRPTLRWPPKLARRAAVLAAVGVLAVVAQQIFLVVAIRLANEWGAVGTLNVYQYSQAVALVPFAVMVLPMTTTVFPRLAAHAAAKRTDQFARLAAVSTRTAMLCGAAAAAVVVATAPTVAQLFTQLDSGDVGSLRTALLLSAPGVVGLAVLTHVGRVLFSSDKRNYAVLAPTVGWAAAAVISHVLVANGWRDTDTALALAAGVSGGMIVGAVTAWWAARRLLGQQLQSGAAWTLGVSVLVGGVAAFIGWELDRLVVPLAPAGVVGSVLVGLLSAVGAFMIMLVGALVLDPQPLWGLSGVDRIKQAAPSVDPIELTYQQASSIHVLLALATSTGGVGRHVQALASGLVARGCEVTVAGPSQTLDQFVGTTAGVRTAPVEIGHRPSLGRDFRNLRELRRLAVDATVVHAHGVRAGALAVLATVNQDVPVVVTVHNAALGNVINRRIFNLLELVVARAALVAVVSSDLESRMRDLGAKRLELAMVPAPGAVAMQAATRALAQNAGTVSATPVEKSGAVIRQELGIDQGTALVVTAARLAPQKGLGVLLQAVEQMLRQQTTWGSFTRMVCVIAGEGPLREELTTTIVAKALPVRLLGHRDDVPLLLQAANVVAVPSRWEGQPLVVQEALAAGTAIVATDAGGTADVVGGAALLVPAGDPLALADAITELLVDDDRRHELECRALQRANELPTDEDALNQVVGWYLKHR